MTYRVVQDQPCKGRWPCTKYLVGDAARCEGCRGDGTRMVDVAEVWPATDELSGEPIYQTWPPDDRDDVLASMKRDMWMEP